MIQDRATDRLDIASVLTRPSRITRAEMFHTGMRAPEWIASMQRDLDLGAGRTVMVDNRPAAVLTWRPFTPAIWLTSFAATSEFFANHAALRYFRRLTRKILLASPGITFAVSTKSTHPQADKWLRSLGLVRQGDTYQASGG